MEGTVTISLEDYEILQERIDALEYHISELYEKCTIVDYDNRVKNLVDWKKNYDKKYKFI